MEHFLQYLDPIFLITTFGVLGIFAIIFAESGLFFGFFLPGDSLLFTAGLLASQGYFDFWLLWAGCIFYAILGDSVGYAFGSRVGPALFRREDSRFFKKAYLHKTHAFYEKYGKKTIVLARFVPVVRTFAPILAGVGRMPYRTFFAYNCMGGLLWVTLLAGLGFALGEVVPDIEEYLLPIILLIIVASFLPALPSIVGSRRRKAVRDADIAEVTREENGV